MDPVTIQVTGHRLNEKALLAQPQVRRIPVTISQMFGQALADEVGVEVSAMINGGKWWVSRHPRFAKYRSWVRMNYGSDRARKSGTRQRTLENPNPDPKDNPASQDEMNDWGNTQHLMTQWISRQLARDMREVKIGDGTGATRRRYYVTSLKGRGEAVDVTSAVRVLERLAEANASERIKNHTDSRELRMRNLQQALNHGGMQSLKTSRYGQRLYRMAYLAAQQQIKERNAAKAESGGKESKRKKPNRAGSFKWGVQTGRLAEAWGNAQHRTVLKANGKLTVRVFANRDGDMVRTSSGLKSLTGMLLRKRNGPKRLMNQNMARKVIRKAIKSTVSELNSTGMRVRLRK